MKIILDTMSGCVPEAAVLGAADALAENAVEIVLVGDEALLMQILKRNALDPMPRGLSISSAGEGAAPGMPLTDIVLRQKNSSLLAGLALLAGADGLISAVSIDALLSNLPLKKEAQALLEQARDRELLVGEQNVLIPSLEDAAVFLGRGVKQLVKKDPRVMLKVMGARGIMGDFVELLQHKELARLLRVKKSVLLLQPGSGREAIKQALSGMKNR